MKLLYILFIASALQTAQAYIGSHRLRRILKEESIQSNRTTNKCNNTNKSTMTGKSKKSKMSSKSNQTNS